MKKEVKANSIETRITPNTKIVLKQFFKECKHIVNEEIDMPKELVNKTEKEIKEKYIDWEVIEFSNEKVVLYKEIDDRFKKEAEEREKERLKREAEEKERERIRKEEQDRIRKEAEEKEKQRKAEENLYENRRWWNYLIIRWYKG